LSRTVTFPLISIIILNYNCRQYIERCLDAVSKVSYPNLEVLVVDNASSDGSAELVEKKYPFVQLLKSPKNIGFAAGNNLGIAQAKGEYILLLNPDTEIDACCVEHLFEVMNADDKVAVCGAKICLLDRRNMIQHAGGKYSLLGVSIDRGMCELDEGQYDKVEEVTFVCGAAMMFRRSLVLDIGLLDSSFFLYHEDVDFCIRAWLYGGKVIYVPKAVVYHKSGYLTDVDQKVSNPLVVFHKHKNTFLILLKNFSLPTVFFWFPLSVLYRLFWVMSFLSKHDAQSALAVLKATFWIFRNLDKIMIDRQNLLKLKTVNESKLKKLFDVTGDVWLTYRKLSML
jgi:GT2 family glycosyltransferase